VFALHLERRVVEALSVLKALVECNQNRIDIIPRAVESVPGMWWRFWTPPMHMKFTLPIGKPSPRPK